MQEAQNRHTSCDSAKDTSQENPLCFFGTSLHRFGFVWQHYCTAELDRNFCAGALCNFF